MGACLCLRKPRFVWADFDHRSVLFLENHFQLACSAVRLLALPMQKRRPLISAIAARHPSCANCPWTRHAWPTCSTTRLVTCLPACSVLQTFVFAGNVAFHSAIRDLHTFLRTAAYVCIKTAASSQRSASSVSSRCHVSTRLSWHVLQDCPGSLRTCAEVMAHLQPSMSRARAQ